MTSPAASSRVERAEAKKSEDVRDVEVPEFTFDLIVVRLSSEFLLQNLNRACLTRQLLLKPCSLRACRVTQLTDSGLQATVVINQLCHLVNYTEYMTQLCQLGN